MSNFTQLDRIAYCHKCCYDYYNLNQHLIHARNNEDDLTQERVDRERLHNRIDDLASDNEDDVIRIANFPYSDHDKVVFTNINTNNQWRNSASKYFEG